MRAYPYALHCLCMTPTAMLLVCLHIWIGPEDAVYAYFSAIRAANPFGVWAMEVFTHGALLFFYPVYAFFLFRGLRDKKIDDILFVVCYLAAQILIAAVLCRFVKIAVGRPRPMTGGPFVPFSLGYGYQSFPSGHTGEALGASMPFIWRYGRAAPVLLPLGLGAVLAAVAFSRIFLGMHHLTDIWGGLVIGSLSGYASWAFYGALHGRWRRLLPQKAKNWLQAGVK